MAVIFYKQIFLQLPIDEVYVTAVQNIVHNYLAHISPLPSVTGKEASNKRMSVSPLSWEVDNVGLQMLTAVQQLLIRVKCEVALCCTSWLVTELPMGKRICASESVIRCLCILYLYASRCECVV